MPDVYVTAHHLRDLLNETSLAQLLAWSREPGLLPRVPAAPCRGRAWAGDALGDLQSLAAERDVDVRFTAQTELRRRGMGEPPEPASVAQQRLV